LRLFAAVLLAIVAFGVLRNIPGMPLIGSV
jgi:hypothetical protein